MVLKFNYIFAINNYINESFELLKEFRVKFYLKSILIIFKRLLIALSKHNIFFAFHLEKKKLFKISSNY